MGLKKCEDCNSEISERAAWCPNCGRPHYTPQGPKLTVGDVQMPFGSMVTFMVKWAIAAIPAILILLLIGSMAAGVIAAIGRSM